MPARRRLPWLVLPLAVVTAVGVAQPSGAVVRPGGHSGGARTPELSISRGLADRRFVTAGTRAYEVATQDGHYPAMGFHTQGEMGGIWSAPLKLLDGVWFGVNGAWLPPASRFTSGWGYTRLDFPAVGGVKVSRTDVVPDGRRGMLVRLTLTSTRRHRDATPVTLSLDAHSELMSAYPWGSTTPSQTVVNLPDTARVDGGRLVFRDTGTPPVANASAHDYAAVVGAVPGSKARLVGSATGTAFRGPQDPPVVCPSSGTAPDRCDDTAFGKGAGGQLRYRVSVPRNGSATVWFAVAGSDRGLAAARGEFGATSSRPDAQLARKVASRRALAANTQVSLPGDRLLQNAIAWGKQNLADLTQEAGGPQGRPLQVRETNAGTNYPAPAGTVNRIRFYGAGFPDYPWLFATDGEYTDFAAVAVGQFGTAKDHLRALRDVSLTVNGNSGKVVHEVVTDGSVFFGANADNGNTDETVKFPSAVALLWRWTGDDAFRDEMFAFTRRNLEYATTVLDADKDGWPEGAGNVERNGQGAEKLDNAAYLIRGELDFAAMARSKGLTAEADAWTAKARALMARFESAWWFGDSNPGSPTPGRADAYADSLSDAPAGTDSNTRIYQRYWTGVVPMEAELWLDDATVPGLASAQHANPALDLRQTPCFTTSSGLVHTGSGATTNPNTPQPFPTTNCAAGAGSDQATSDQPDERDSFSLNTAIMAVGEGNYGRLGADQQQFYTDAVSRVMFTPDEMPGAMEEILPSDPHPPYYGHSTGRVLNERASVMQAWGNYATMWPVVHQQLGISPDLGNGRLAVVPQVPDYAGSRPISARNVRVGTGSVDVAARHAGRSWTTTLTSRVRADLTVGVTLPAGTHVSGVALDGRWAAFDVRDTNRGREITVHVGTHVRSGHTLRLKVLA